MQELTSKQNDIYQAIVRYHNTYGYFPTIRELCKLTGRSSTATIQEYLRRLDLKGWIIWAGDARKSKIV